MPAISVVMPVYNTKDYVGKAIESILNQTFCDFEFLIIDNGSNDGSSEIIGEYAKSDTRIRVIKNKENVFIADARNEALKLIKGEFLNLIDSDDWLEADALEIMYKRAKEYNAQYVVAGYFMDYYEGGKNLSYTVCPEDVNYNQKDFRQNAIKYLTRTLLTVPWNKLYSIDYIKKHNILFRHTKLEDHHFNMDFIMDVERVSMVSKPFYHYFRSRKGTDSQLVYNKFLNQKKRDHIAHTLEVYKHWGINDKNVFHELAVYHLKRLLQCISETVGNSNLTRIEKKDELVKIFNDVYTNFALKNLSGSSVKLKILSLPIKWKSIIASSFMGHCINATKRVCPVLFNKMRVKVAQNAEKNKV